MEMEYTSMAASIERRLSHQSSEDGSLPEGTTSVKCPICDVTEMQADKGNVCVECERFVCHSCGSFEMSQNTKVRKYVFCQFRSIQAGGLPPMLMSKYIFVRPKMSCQKLNLQLVLNLSRTTFNFVAERNTSF